MLGFEAQGSENRGLTYPFCEECGKNHLVACREGSDVCFGCGKPRHRIRECRVLAQRDKELRQQGTKSGQR